MPWCQRCDRFLNPNTVTTEGTCPSCGQGIDGPGEAGRISEGDVADGDMDDEEVSAPWHFWVMIVGVVLYLGWRVVEAIIWGADRLF